jgi:hypothetical protein
MAAIEIGLALVFGDGPAPTRAGLRTTPDEAPDDPRFPVLRPLDDGRSLDRIAAHGVLRIALEPDLRSRRTAERKGTDTALIVPGKTTLDLDALWAAIRALEEVEDLLRPDEPILFARALDAPWVLALALAAYARGAPILFGGAVAARTYGPGVIVHGGLLQADLITVLEEDYAGRRGYLDLLRRARASRDRGGPAVIGSTRAVLIADGDLPVAGYERIHALGCLPLRLATSPDAAGPALLNRPGRYRLDALGVPLPSHTADVVDGWVRVDGPCVAAPERSALTAIRGHLEPDGFILPMSEPTGH